MTKLSLDLYHGTSKKKSTAIEFNDLPQFNIRYYSDNPDNVYLCADTQWMKFITNYNYIVEVEVLNEPEGTVVNLNAFGRWYEGVIYEMMAETEDLSNAKYFPQLVSERKLNGSPVGLVDITPLNDGKIQSNGRARFRVKFKNRADQKVNGFRVYKTTLEVSTGRGVARSLNEYEVSYNPEKTGLARNYVRDVEGGSEGVMQIEDFIDIPANDYGCSVELVIVGSGGGASTPRAREDDPLSLGNKTKSIAADGGDTYMNLRCPGNSPGNGGMWSILPRVNIGPRLFYYNDSHTNYTSNLGYSHIWPNRSGDYETKRYTPWLVYGGVGGGGAFGSDHIDFLSELVAETNTWAYQGTFKEQASSDFVADTSTSGLRAYVDIGYEVIESSDGVSGTYDIAGNSVKNASLWGVKKEWGAGGKQSQLPRYGGKYRAVGGGSGAYVKLRIYIRRKKAAKNIPLPPLTMGFGDFLTGATISGGFGGNVAWWGNPYWKRLIPEVIYFTQEEMNAVAQSWTAIYGANPKPGRGVDGCCGITSVTNFTSFA